MMTLTKLLKLSTSIGQRVWIALCILCHWVADQKNILSMLKTLPKHVWSEVGASHQGSTSAYSGMPGEPRYDNEYKNEQHKKAMQAEIKEDPSDALRKAGL